MVTEERSAAPAIVVDSRDDRRAIQVGDRVLLIAEDDPDFGAFLLEAGRSHGFKCLLAPDGHSALSLISEYQADAVVLDITLPNLDGWRLLDRLKSDLGTRHIPVAIVSASEEAQRGLRTGCYRFCEKPVTREQVEEVIGDLYQFVEAPKRHLLIFGGDPAQRTSINELIGNLRVEITPAKNAESALALLGSQHFDCLLVDLRMPGRISGDQLLEEIRRQSQYHNLATIVFTDKELSPEEEARLNQLARSIVLKDVRIEVSDSGMGLAPEAMPRIFDAFEQVGRSQSGGLGLGLAISKAISGYGMDEDVARSKAAGFHIHLTKPVSSGNFRERLTRSWDPAHGIGHRSKFGV